MDRSSQGRRNILLRRSKRRLLSLLEYRKFWRRLAPILRRQRIVGYDVAFEANKAEMLRSVTPGMIQSAIEADRYPVASIQN